MSSMSKRVTTTRNRAEFPSVTRKVGDNVQRGVIAICSKCRREEFGACNHSGLGVRIFKQRGWLLGSRRSSDLCPGCRKQKPPSSRELSPAQKRAAYLRMDADHNRREAEAAGVELPPQDIRSPTPLGPLAEALAPLAEKMKAEEEAKAKASPIPGTYGQPFGYRYGFGARAAAKRKLEALGRPLDQYTVHRDPDGTWSYQLTEETKEMSTAAIEPPAEEPRRAPPPPKPTVADRRRIGEALDEHYDTDAGRYRKAFSDDAVAQKLNVPRAWVAEVRAFSYGEGAGNESDIEKAGKLDAAIQLAENAVTRIFEMAQEAEKIAADLKAARSKLGA